MDDYDKAENHIHSYYEGFEAHLHHPCLSAYKKGRENFTTTLNSVDQMNALILSVGFGLVSAGIGGCLGALLAGRIASMGTKVSSVVWAGNTVAQARWAKALEEGGVELVQAVTQAAVTSPVTLLAGSVGLNLADESPVDFEKEDQMWSRIKTEKKKALDLLYRVAKSNDKATAGGASNGVGPLEALAIKITGKRETHDVSDREREKQYEVLARRFELVLWWEWLVKQGPIRAGDKGGAGQYKYCDREIADWSWVPAFAGGSFLPYDVQVRLKELTRLPPSLINRWFIPHFCEFNGKLLLNQNVQRNLNHIFGKEEEHRRILGG